MIYYGTDERDQYLQHYGVKGMKWGVRKAAITAGIGAGLVAYGAMHDRKRKIQGKQDYVIKKGTKMQRMISLKDPKDFRAGGQMYVSFTNSDKKLYNRHYARNLYKAQRRKKSKHYGNKLYRMEIPTNKDLKIASDETGKKMYKQMMKNDPQFRSEVLKAFKQGNYHVRYNPKLYTKSKTIPGKAYDAFVASIPHLSDETKNRFYSNLQKQGYDGFSDMYDRALGGYSAKRPTILFDGPKKYSITEQKTANRLPAMWEEIKMNGRSYGGKAAKIGGTAMAVAAVTPKLIKTAKKLAHSEQEAERPMIHSGYGIRLSNASSHYIGTDNGDSLTHYGVKGMKWGIRRKLSNVKSRYKTEKAERKEVRSRNKAVRKERRKAARDMSVLTDEEIRKRINRLQMEKQLKNLTDENVNPRWTAAKTTASTIGKNVATNVATNLLTNAAKGGIASAMGRAGVSNALTDLYVYGQRPNADTRTALRRENDELQDQLKNYTLREQLRKHKSK